MAVQTSAHVWHHEKLMARRIQKLVRSMSLFVAVYALLSDAVLGHTMA